jgi:hypothetical protein
VAVFVGKRGGRWLVHQARIRLVKGKVDQAIATYVITPSTKLVTLFNWRRIGRGVRKSSSSPPWASPV